MNFTQYLRPDGRKRFVTIERSGDVEAMAERLVKIGARFEVEQLTTGEVSLECILQTDEPQILSSAICANGPGVPEAVDKLVEDAYTRWAVNDDKES